MAKSACANKNLKFKSSEASTKANMRTLGLINKQLEILDYKGFLEYVSKWSKYAQEKYGIEGRLFSPEFGGTKAVPNKEMFYRIDAFKGIYYKENEYLRPDYLPRKSNVEFTKFEFDKEKISQDRAEVVMGFLGEKMMQTIDVPYQYITEEEGKTVLDGTSTPYRNEPGFYYGNMIYLVKGKATLGTMIHEFGHPLIKGISIENNKLFNNLYNKAKTTPTGMGIIEDVKRLYPKLQFESDRFKEEVLVRSLEIDAMNKLEKTRESDQEFKGFIDMLMYAIKNLLRKVFTKIQSVKDLKSTTTLSELSDMLLYENVKFSNLKFNETDYAEMKVEFDQLVDELQNVDKKKLQDAINQTYVEAKYQINQLKAAPWKLKDDLTGKRGLQILANVRDFLGRYQTVNVKPEDIPAEAVVEALDAQNEEFRIRASALVSSLSETKVFTTKIEEILKDMEANNTHLTDDGISKIDFFKDFLNRQATFLKSIKKTVGLSRSNEFTKEISDVLDIVAAAKDKISDLQKEFVIDFMQDNTMFMKDELERKITERVNDYLSADKIPQEKIDELVEKILSNPDGKTLSVKDLGPGISPARAAELVREVGEFYQKRLGRDQIIDWVEGRTEDIGILEAYLNPYMSIDDPLGSFVRYMKEKLSDAEQESLRQETDILETILPLMQQAGLKPGNIERSGEALLSVDKVGDKDEKGDFIEREIYVIKQKFGNGWRADRDKLQDEYEKAQEAGDKTAMKEALRNIWKFEDDYMHKEKVPEYYAVQNIWKQENKIQNPFTKEMITIPVDMATEAYIERQKAIGELTIFRSKAFTTMDDVYTFTEADEAQKRYDSLFLLFDEKGKPKTGEDLQKTLVRLEYRKQSRKFYEFVPNDSRVQDDLNAFVQDLAARKITLESNPDEFNRALKQWEERNFRIAYVPKYYEERDRILSEIRVITQKSKKSKVADDLAELYRQRFALADLITDRNGQTNALEYKPEQFKLMKDIEEKIVSLENKVDTKSGLLTEELERLQGYEEKMAVGMDLTDLEQDDYDALITKQNELGLSDTEYKKLKDLFADLRGLTIKQPTEYYYVAFNNMLGDTEVEHITFENADDWINSENLYTAIEANPEFAEWFENNHYKKEVWDKATKSKKDRWFRTRMWTSVKPVDETHYKKTELVHPVTKEKLIIDGVPGPKYTYQRVKEEYFTVPFDQEARKKYVGKIIDNNGNFLPREYKSGDPNSAVDAKYMSKEYIEAERDPAMKKLIDKVSETLLNMQENRPGSSKTYLDLPRFRKRTNLELMKSGKATEDIKERGSAAWEAVKSNFAKRKDDYESFAVNFNPEINMMSTDLEGNPIARIPVRGLYRLDLNETSTDVLSAMFDYNYSLNKQAVLIKEKSKAEALRAVLTDPDNAIKHLNKVSKQIAKNTGVLSFLKTSDNRRADALEYFIDKTFYGQAYSAWEQEYPTWIKVANTLMHNASRSFIAFDLVSAVKNRFGMIVQNTIEAAAGVYYNPISFASGRMWAYQSAIELAGFTGGGIYKRGAKSLNLQLIDIFDPVIGKVEKDYGKTATRSFIRDMFDGTWAYDARKLMEVEGAFQVMGGMMYHKEIEQVQPDGSVKKIKYVDAWELNDKKEIVLKPGINPEWGNRYVDHVVAPNETLEAIAKRYNIPVEELAAKNKIKSTAKLTEGQELVISRNRLFNDYKLKIQGVQKRLNGAMDSVDSPQAEKFLLYRLFTFYKKFATGMFLNRFQTDLSKNNRWGNVYNWELGTTTKGYYISAIQGMYKTIRSGGAYWPVMQKEEKAAFKKVLTEGMMLALMALAVTFIFGWDPADEDRFKKLEKRQEDYGYFGWMANHMLYQLITVKRENQSFIPLPWVGGLDEWYKYGDVSSIAFGPTIGLYLKILADLGYMATGNEKAVYRQEAGPYPWQDEGRYKLWNHLASIYGIKGKNISPIWAIRRDEQFQNLK
jgi:LysM repeat protein